MVRKMFVEECSAFAHDRDDIGCIPSSKMSTRLTDDTPVQKNPMLLSQSQCIGKSKSMLVKGWIVKSQSSYAAPIVYVREKDGRSGCVLITAC